MKVMHPEERREAWIRRRAEWWANRRLGRSSEDVWDIREYVYFFLLVFKLDVRDVKQRAPAQLSKTHHTRANGRA